MGCVFALDVVETHKELVSYRNGLLGGYVFSYGKLSLAPEICLLFSII